MNRQRQTLLAASAPVSCVTMGRAAEPVAVDEPITQAGVHHVGTNGLS